MRRLALVIALCWLVFWVYWIVSAVGAKRDSRSYIKQFFAVRLGILVLAAALALIFHRLPDSLTNHLPVTNKAMLAVGFIGFLLGLGLAVWARVYLGRNWGMPMTQKQDPELVTTGPYRYIRHPIYSGMLLMTLGSALDVNAYWLLGFVVAAVFFIYSALAEERNMTKQFPKTYPTYKSQTKMLVPFIL